MNETTNVPRSMAGAMKLAIARKSAPNFIKGRRDFFKYRELGVTDATGGAMRAQVTSASRGLSRSDRLALSRVRGAIRVHARRLARIGIRERRKLPPRSGRIR